MMQNSLPRLFEGMAQGLREVLDGGTVEDPYARAQLQATIELLGNLSTRVQWRSDDLLEIVDLVRPILEAGLALPGDRHGRDRVRDVLARPVPAVTDADGLASARREHLGALAIVQQWVAQEDSVAAAEVRERIDRLLGWYLEHELARLRSRSFASR